MKKIEIGRIKKILDAHSVPYYIKDDHIFVDCMLAFHEEFEVVEDATGWSEEKLYQWLGY